MFTYWLMVALGVPLGIVIAGTISTQDNFKEIAIILLVIILIIVIIYRKKFKEFAEKLKEIEI